MGANREFLIKRLIQCIDVYPSKIDLKRENRVDDGMGGYTIEGYTNVASFNAFLNTKSSSLSIKVSDGARVENLNKVTLIVPFSKEYELMKGDIFILGDVTYRIKNPNPQLDVCYVAELEVIECPIL